MIWKSLLIGIVLMAIGVLMLQRTHTQRGKEGTPAGTRRIYFYLFTAGAILCLLGLMCLILPLLWKIGMIKIKVALFEALLYGLLVLVVLLLAAFFYFKGKLKAK
ncbi:MAG: hypothetical protein Q4P72_06300 [Eubacteriales bacterium]|nr:hypothetical protein [Eubacteriales bacterium]